MNKLQLTITWASTSLPLWRHIHSTYMKQYSYASISSDLTHFQSTFLPASVAAQPQLITIRNMSRCEMQLPLSNLEANLRLAASVITPLKFRKLLLQTALKTGPEEEARQGWWQTLHWEALCWVRAFPKKRKKRRRKPFIFVEDTPQNSINQPLNVRKTPQHEMNLH